MYRFQLRCAITYNFCLYIFGGNITHFRNPVIDEKTGMEKQNRNTKWNTKKPGNNTFNKNPAQLRIRK